MGFNNEGQSAALARLQAGRRRGLVGVNIGASKDKAGGDAAIADYSAGVAAMTGVADYLTGEHLIAEHAGLRDLQDAGALDALLAAVTEVRGAGPPIFLKVAPDLEPGQIDAIARIAIDRRIDALIVGNTTLSRPALASPHRDEAGGLSGAPLKRLALDRLRDFPPRDGRRAAFDRGRRESRWVDADRIRAGASRLSGAPERPPASSRCGDASAGRLSVVLPTMSASILRSIAILAMASIWPGSRSERP